MKAVAAMRNQFGGHAVRTPAPKGGDVEDGGRRRPDGDGEEGRRRQRPGARRELMSLCTSRT